MKVDNTRPAQRISSVAKSRNRSGRKSTVTDIGAVTDSSSIMGIPDAELTPRVRDAIMKLMAEIDDLRKELSQNRSRVVELEEIADLDGMLPVLNRRAFMRELTRIMSFAERYRVQASMIYIDFDNFKNINDTHGHAAGDAILRQVSDFLLKNIRNSDVLGRLGGDEFGIILAQANAEQAVQKAQNLVDSISRQSFAWKGKNIEVRLSHGVYGFERGTDADEALMNADRAMYRNKLARRDPAD